MNRASAKAIEKSLSVLMTIEAILAVCALLATCGLRVVGFESFEILSGSMEPAIPVHSLVYVNTNIACEDIREGDVIAFDIGEGKKVTHRVAGVDEKDRQFSTKGDANALPDPEPVSFDNVVGRECACIPHLGAILNAFSNHKAPCLIALAAANLILCAASHALRKRKGR